MRTADRWLAVLTALFALFLVGVAMQGPTLPQPRSAPGVPVGPISGLAWTGDAALFTALIVLVAAAYWQAMRRTTDRRDRWAWGLLGLTVVLRGINASWWRVASLAQFPLSGLLSVLVAIAFVAEASALISFRDRPRSRADAVRFWLDVLTATMGVLVAGWYVTLGTLFSGDEGSRLLGTDRMVTGGYVLLSLLSIVLWLRRGDAVSRRTATALVFANGLMVVPDVVLSLNRQVSYMAGDPSTAWRWLMWLLRYYAVREALAAPRAPVRVGYRGGGLPYVFLALTSLILFLEAAEPTPNARVGLIFGYVVIAAGLVARQVIEVQELGRLRRTRADDEARFAALAQHAFDIVLLVRDDGRVDYATPTSTQFTGLAYSMEIARRPWAFLEAVAERDRDRLQRFLRDPASTPGGITCAVRGEDGSWHDVALTAEDRRTDSRVGAVVLHGHDITRETRLAQRLRETEEVEALGVFAGGIAHDLNNVLGAISSHVELLQEEPIAADPAAARELEAIGAATSHAATLTRNLLTLSRRKSPTLERVPLREFLGELDATLDLDEVTTVLAERTSLSRALDALLLRVTSGGARLGRWHVQVRREALTSRDASALNLEPGHYARIELSSRAVSFAEGASPAMPLLDEEDINVLLARAVLREMGGSVAVRATTARLAYVLHLPAADA